MADNRFYIYSAIIEVFYNRQHRGQFKVVIQTRQLTGGDNGAAGGSI